MDHHHPPIRSLVLLGGQSSRMGKPKYLLDMPSEVSEVGEEAPLLIHTLNLHHMFQVKHGDPLIRTVTLSVRDQTQRNEVKALVQRFHDDLPIDLSISYVQDSQPDCGPALGLVAAWRLDSNAHWLVVGCDYPLITKAALEELMDHHHQSQRAVTCFVNSDGWNEPLLALWTGAALERLNSALDEKANMGPNYILKSFEKEEPIQIYENDRYTKGLKQVTPTDGKWVTSVNTEDEWNTVERMLSQKFGHSDP